MIYLLPIYLPTFMLYLFFFQYLTKFHDVTAEREDGRKREREPEEFEDDHEEIEDTHRQKAKQRKSEDHAELR